MLQTLGEEYLGLTSLFQNLIGFLSLAELGIGGAIVYALYKPIAENDHAKTNALLAYYQNAYIKISGVIAATSISLMLFFPQVIKTDITRPTVIVAFLIFLQSTLMSYWFSSRLSLFFVAQRSYVVTALATGFRLVTLLLQIGLLYLLKNYFVFLLVQVALDALYFMCVNLLAKKYFPWISSSARELTTNEKKDLNKRTSAVFCHKLGSFVVLGSDSIIISVFVSLAAVGRYSNYNMLFSTAINVVVKMFDGVAAGIGHLLATESGEYSYDVHKKLMFINFVIVSFISILLARITKSFIPLWLGGDFSLDTTVLWLLVFNFYFLGMRLSVERFKEGAGLFVQDWWSPVAEAALNLVLALLFVQKWGIAGVLLATTLSNLCVVFWVKPLIVYRDVFKKPLSNYFLSYAKYLLVALFALGLSYAATVLLPPVSLLMTLIRDTGLICIIVSALYWALFRHTDEFRFYSSSLKALWISFRAR
jgi:O-antigen/teichoic acid export membrane protein